MNHHHDILKLAYSKSQGGTVSEPNFSQIWQRGRAAACTWQHDWRDGTWQQTHQGEGAVTILKFDDLKKEISSLFSRFPWLTRRIALKMVRCHLLAELESKLLICLELKSFPTYVQCDMTPLTFLRWRCISSLCNLGRDMI